MPGFSVSVVIPAFNEQEAVAPLVREIRQVLTGRVPELEIIVVDDGSTDDTAAAARGAEALVISHPANRGYGKTLMTGIMAAKNEWILMIDADNSYSPREIPKLLEFVPAFDLVIGQRSGQLFWGSPFPALLRWVYLRLSSFVAGEPIPDANSGLRIYRRQLAVKPGLVRCLGYSFTTTMTLAFIQSGRFVKFVPIQFQARTGKSKVRPVRDILRTLQLMTEVFIVYNPLKFTITLAAFPAMAGAMMAVVFLAGGQGFWALGSILCATLSALFFLTGLILDSVRLHGQASGPGQ